MKNETQETVRRRETPLRLQIKNLKLGEHVMVEFSVDSKVPFNEAINCQRKYLKKGFWYKEMGPGMYDVWLQTVSNEPITQRTALGNTLRGLQFGQRIIVEYPLDKTPSFSMVMAHHRKNLKKGFLYDLLEPGKFEVWLGTLEESAAAHRGLRHAQTCLTQAEFAAMKSDVSLDRDWITIIYLAFDCGIPVCVGRKLLWKHVFFELKEIEFIMPHGTRSVRRSIPGDLLEYLNKSRTTAKDDASPLCPNLSEIPNHVFHNGWPRLRKQFALPSSRSLSALTWPWNEVNPQQRNREVILNHIAALEKKWLNPAELLVVSKIAKMRDNTIPCPATP